MVQVRQVIAGTPPVTGVSQLSNLTDVNDSDKANGRFIVWNTSTGKHEYYGLDENFAIDSATNTYNFVPAVLDSAAVNVLIANSTIDSASVLSIIVSDGYIKLDSAGVIALIGADGFTKFDSAAAQVLITNSINTVIGGAPGALDTLNELAAAIGDDPTFITTIQGLIEDLPDSAQVSGIILNDVDSAYVQARQDYAWGSITGTPTTLSGYGITDALALAGGTMAGNINMNTHSLTNVGSISVTTLTAGAVTFPTIDGTSGQALVTDGNGNLVFAFAGDSGGGAVAEMRDLSDVIATLNNDRAEGHYLKFDSALGVYVTSNFDSDALSAAKVGFSATDAGGLGSFTYTDGVYTYTGPSDADIRSLFSVASGNLSYDSNTGQFDVTTYNSTNFDSDFGSKSTTDLAEGTNLYYTTARFDTGFSGKSTTDLAEGTNLYYTDVRFDNRLGSKTTDNLTEGSTNLYYTTGRFDTRLAAKTTTDLAEGTNLYYTTLRADSAATDLITRAFVKALGIDLDDVTDNGATTTNNITVGQITTTNGAVVHTVSTTTITSDTLTAIDATAHDSDYLSLEYSLLAFNDSAGESQTAKVLVTYDKTRVASTEYGVVFTGDSDLGNYTVDLTNGDVRLLFQRRPSNTITLKTTKIVIK